MVIATVDTGRFEFTVLADDEKHARLVLRRAYRLHRTQYPSADRNLMDELLSLNEVNFVTIPGPGVALRDGEVLINHTH